MPFTSVATSMTKAWAGLHADNGAKDVRSFVSAEASAEIPFGVMVAQGTADDQAILFASNANKMIGIVAHSHAYQQPLELGATGLKPGVQIGVVEKGRYWVKVEEAVTPASPVRIRCTAAGAGAGSFRTTSAGAGLSINISSFARYLSTAALNGFAIVEIDMLMRSGAVND